MADDIGKTAMTNDDTDSKVESLPVGIEDAAPIPKGTIDPVYEAKARVLNHAVRLVGPGLCGFG